jgi:Protein of unknown function (DUF3892)
MTIRITCIKKDAGNHENALTAISELGWKEESTGATGRKTRLEMYNWLSTVNIAYVKDGNGNMAYLMKAETARGTKYVKTKPDATPDDNLLKLGEC